jgi:hypothetical protein
MLSQPAQRSCIRAADAADAESEFAANVNLTYSLVEFTDVSCDVAQFIVCRRLAANYKVTRNEERSNFFCLLSFYSRQ